MLIPGPFKISSPTVNTWPLYSKAVLQVPPSPRPTATRPVVEFVRPVVRQGVQQVGEFTRSHVVAETEGGQKEEEEYCHGG